MPRSRCGYPLARAGAAIHLRRWYRSAWRWVTDRLRPARPGPTGPRPVGTGWYRSAPACGTNRYRPGGRRTDPPGASGQWPCRSAPSLWPPARPTDAGQYQPTRPVGRRLLEAVSSASARPGCGCGRLDLGTGGRPLLIWQERLAGAAGDGSVGEVGGEVREGEAGGVGGHRDQAGGGEAGAGVDLEDLARAVEVEDGVDSRDVAAT